MGGSLRRASAIVTDSLIYLLDSIKLVASSHDSLRGRTVVVRPPEMPRRAAKAFRVVVLCLDCLK